MPGIKKLDIFVLKSFLILFAGTFFICLFIFMMQFLWRNVDELVGKGLEMIVLAQFFYYSALHLVPAALPLAILLASLITFGNFGERYELLAMKAAGISLFEIMRSLIVLVTMLGCISFYFQDIVAPYAQLKLYTLLYSLSQKSPELDIPEGVFYDDIDKYNLYIKKKDRKTGILYDVMIYDLSGGFENTRIYVADRGKLEMTADKKHLYLHLYDGESFENLDKQQAGNVRNIPYRRETFSEKHAIIEFDSEFNMVDESLVSGRSNSKNMATLAHDIDSMSTANDSVGRRYYEDSRRAIYHPITLNKEDTVKVEEANMADYNVDDIYARYSLTERQKVLSTAVSRAESQASDWSFKKFQTAGTDQNIRRHQTEWHRKITIALSCLIFFFIGAPLGAIIRKGGLGMPVVVSVVLFIFYYVIDSMGYKMARDGKWMMIAGMWLSSAVLVPLGAFLSYKSNKDSVVFNPDVYTYWIKHLMGIRSVRSLMRKDVIIEDPEYEKLLPELDRLSEECRNCIDFNRLEKTPGYIGLWMDVSDNGDIVHLNARLESLIDRMSNSESAILINELNNYPILSVNAHKKTFPKKWANIAAAIILPVGLILYFRIWFFRRRLRKDLERIIDTNESVKYIITNKILD